MAKHDENKDLILLARNGAKIDYCTKVIKISKTNVGIHTWGKLDFLTKYKGWFVNTNGVTLSSDNLNSTDDNSVKFEKRVKKHNLKEPKLKKVKNHA